MFFGKTEHKRSHPYAAAMIGTLAMIGAFNVVRCAKRTTKCVCNRMTSMFRGKEGCDLSPSE